MEFDPVGDLAGPLDERDFPFLRRVIALATKAREFGDPPYGAILVSLERDVIAEERNTTVTDNDITAHPELKLARWAAQTLPGPTARETTMYTSCQPCPMCTNAIDRAGLARVVFALSLPQLQALKPAGVTSPDAVAVPQHGPALEAEAEAPLLGYYRQQQPE